MVNNRSSAFSENGETTHFERDIVNGDVRQLASQLLNKLRSTTWCALGGAVIGILLKRNHLSEVTDCLLTHLHQDEV